MKNLLIVEDDEYLLGSLKREFSDLGYNVNGFLSVEAMREVNDPPFDYAILDLRIGLQNGLLLIPALLAQNPAGGVVVLTGYGSISTAVKAMQYGAKNYLIKPASIKQIEQAFLGVKPEIDKVPEAMPSLAEFERNYVEFVLEQCEGNKTTAAGQLGIPRQSLQRKLRKFSPWKKR